MTRLRLLALSIPIIVACAGLPPATHPLFIARNSDSTAQQPMAAEVAVEMNNVLLTLPASSLTACSDLLGEYVRKGEKVDVRLRQGPSSTGCEASARSFVTRIGPLPPGSYEVTVTLDGKPLIRAERANIS